MRIQTLTVTATGLEDLRQFYCGVIGLTQHTTDQPDTLVVQAGFTQLTFKEGGPGWNGRYHFAFDIPSHRLSAAQNWLAQRREALVLPEGGVINHSESWDADSFYFTDPHGNILELIARNELAGQEPDNAVGPHEPFDAMEITSVSEFGVAASTVTGAVAALTENIPGLTTYREGSDTFCPVGDAHGLLIVVQYGRIWFPQTGVPAEPLPFTAVLEMPGGQRYQVTNPPDPFSIVPVV